MRIRWKSPFLPALAAAALVAAACQDTARNPVATAVPTTVPFHPGGWVGCNAGGKFTGGGRVDVSGVGKVTFGFNIQSQACTDSTTKGQMQVVYHETQTLFHTLTMEKFATFPDSTTGGQCAEWSGTARMKDVFAGSGWTDHTYFTQVCDNGEPGRGHDTFSLYLDDAGDGTHNNVINAVLTGGNIQAHK